ncbi:gp436 family protein [Paraburkholderia sp. BR14263]|uniref:gp436 family protein n=1 Tax=unclassified Paraburkholderia TaxID=2615204 RepID=UPI0034CF9B06
MSYATVDDLQARYLERDLIAITDETNQQVIVPRLQDALDDASAEIDSYLGMRYVLPLADAVLLTPLSTPTVLVRACCDIAIYNAQSLRPQDDIKDARKRYEDWMKVLKLMSTGDTQITGALLKTGQATAPADASLSPGMAQIECGESHSPFARRYR